MHNQFTLTPEVISLLRGNVTYTEDGKEIVKAAGICYQNGQNGLPYNDTPAPVRFNPAAVELVERFLQACWQQGREDSAQEDKQ